MVRKNSKESIKKGDIVLLQKHAYSPKWVRKFPQLHFKESITIVLKKQQIVVHLGKVQNYV